MKNQRLLSDRQIFSTKYCQEERRAGMLAKAGEVTVGEQLGAKKDDQHQVEKPPLRFLNPRKVFGDKTPFQISGLRGDIRT